MKKSPKLLKCFLYLSLIIIGIIVGIAIRHYYYIPLAETIDIVDLATLVTTVFLAVYIPEVLDRKLQVKKEKKNLIVLRLEQLQSLYRKINLIVQNEDKITDRDFLVIKNTLDIVQNKLDTINGLLNYAKLDISFVGDIDSIQKLTTDHKNLLLSKKNDNEDFIYSNNTVQQEEEIYNKIDQMTSLLIFKLSDA